MARVARVPPEPNPRYFDDGASTNRILDDLDEDIWVPKLLNQAETKAANGRLLEAVDLIELVLTMEPRNDVARARLHALTARLVRRPHRGDETVRVAC